MLAIPLDDLMRDDAPDFHWTASVKARPNALSISGSETLLNLVIPLIRAEKKLESIFLKYKSLEIRNLKNFRNEDF